MECEKMRTFDYTKLKERKWDSEILGLVAQIHEFKGRQELYLKQKPVELDRLIEIAKVQSTESSNEIEGIRTTNTRLKQLCTDKTTPRNRDEMCGFKNTQNYISAIDGDGNEFVLFTPLAPYEVPTAINKLCEGYNAAVSAQDIDALILIPIFIHDFLCIHPFNDGNGRMSRLLMTLLLYRSGYVVGKYISLESKIAKNKNLYYKALEKCQHGWHDNKEDPSSFIKYLLKIILAAYRDFEDRINVVSNKMSALDIVRKAVESKIGKFKKSDILELCPTIGKASVENSIKKLVDSGEIIKCGSGRSTFYIRSDSQ